MTSSEFRHAHLLLLIEQCGSVDAFAEKVGLAPSYASQLKTSKRGVGNKTARKIESAMGLPRGIMDTPPGLNTSLELGTLLASMPEDQAIEAITQSLGEISPEGLKKLTTALLSELSKP